METKKCTKCGEVKNIADFHKNKSEKDGLNYYCKSCRSSIVKEKFANSTARIVKINKIELLKAGQKQCSKCKNLKHVSDFYFDPLASDGLRSSCKLCNRSACKSYRNVNVEKVKSKSLEWRNNNRDHLRNRFQQYRKENPDKIKESKKAWELKNEEKHKAGRHRRYVKNIINHKQRSIKWYDKNKERLSNNLRKEVSKLTEKYVKINLRQAHIPITPETIQLKRTIIQIKRLKKQLNGKDTTTNTK